MKHLTILTLIAFFTFNGIQINEARAAERDLCICQTGSSPKEEIKFFKLGCNTWNSTQSCSEKIIIGLNDSIDDALASRPEVKSVKLGYVGHWGSSSEVVDFLRDKVIPVAKKRDIYFDIHNSACSSMENPYEIQKYLKSIGEDARHIHFLGNQVISTGGWDPLLPGKNNFWASINGSSLNIEFPNCKEFEKKQCMKMFQNDEQSICFNQNENKFVFLRCQEVKRKVTSPNPNGKGGSVQSTQTQNEWTRYIPELFFEQSKSIFVNKITIGIADSDIWDKNINIDEDENAPAEINKGIEKLAELITNVDKTQPEILVKSINTEEINFGNFVKEKRKVMGRDYEVVKKVVKDKAEGLAFIKQVNDDARKMLQK
jgi:hypothetical protein